MAQQDKLPGQLQKQLLSDEKFGKLLRGYVLTTLTPDNNKKFSFSKLLCLIVILLTLVVTVATFVFITMFNDLSPLEWLIPSIFTECAVVSGFYSYKAKAENEIKLSTRNKLIDKVLDFDISDEEFSGGQDAPEEEECDNNESAGGF